VLALRRFFVKIDMLKIYPHFSFPDFSRKVFRKSIAGRRYYSIMNAFEGTYDDDLLIPARPVRCSAFSGRSRASTVFSS
jgi:hypothetical protein